MKPAAMSNDDQIIRHGGVLKLHRGDAFGEVSFAAPMQSSEQKQRSAQAATAAFIPTLVLGDCADSACTVSRRGGARNRADRESHALTHQQVTNLVAATRHADRIGLPFTRMLTIHWQGAGVPLADMAKATGRFLDLLSKALARHGSRTAWVWVHENGRNKGAHVHILAHVQPALVPVVVRLQRGWLGRISGKTYRRRIIRSRPIGGRLGVETRNVELHRLNLDNALRYLLKGADDEAAQVFELDKRQGGGLIVGKRCGVSQNISAKARRMSTE